MRRFNNFKTFISLSGVLFILLMSMAMTGCATTPLRDAVARNDITAVKELLDKGGDVNENWPGVPLLFLTVVGPVAGLLNIECKMEAAKLLIERGADINAGFTTGWGMGSLALAAYGGCNEIAKLLVEKGADLDDAMSQLANGPFSYEQRSKNGILLLKRITMQDKKAVRQPIMSQNVVSAPPNPKSDIDELPAIKVKPNKNSYAIVIGIEQYRQKLPKADFAAHDAQTMTEYLTKVMGYPEENVVTLLNDRATMSDLTKYFEKWLWNNVEKDGSVFIYYSGHGAPNPKTGDAYLVPYDGDPSFIDQTGYPLKRLYNSLGKLQAKEIIVALDSCFSGAGGRSVIAKGARPLVMTMESYAIPQKIAVLSAASGEQISSTYEEKGHGLFTYFMLKGIKGEGDTNKDGSVDLHELFEYLKPQVERIARKIYNNEQSPQLIAPEERHRMLLIEGAK